MVSLQGCLLRRARLHGEVKIEGNYLEITTNEFSLETPHRDLIVSMKKLLELKICLVIC